MYNDNESKNETNALDDLMDDEFENSGMNQGNVNKE